MCAVGLGVAIAWRLTSDADSSRAAPPVKKPCTMPFSGNCRPVRMLQGGRGLGEWGKLARASQHRQPLSLSLTRGAGKHDPPHVHDGHSKAAIEHTRVHGERELLLRRILAEEHWLEQRNLPRKPMPREAHWQQHARAREREREKGSGKQAKMQRSKRRCNAEFCFVLNKPRASPACAKSYAKATPE